MVKIVNNAEIFAERMDSKQMTSDKYSLNCRVHSFCKSMTNATRLDVKYTEGDEIKVMALEPPCYNNMTISGHIVDRCDSLPPCAASAKAELSCPSRAEIICWRQTGRKEKGATYRARVDIDK
jgi:hypothetical protein